MSLPSTLGVYALHPFHVEIFLAELLCRLRKKWEGYIPSEGTYLISTIPRDRLSTLVQGVRQSLPMSHMTVT